MEAQVKTLLGAAAVVGAIGLGLDVSAAQADSGARVVRRDIDRKVTAVEAAHRMRHRHRRPHVHTHTHYYGPRYSLPRTSYWYAWPDRGYYDYGRVRPYDYMR